MYFLWVLDFYLLCLLSKQGNGNNGSTLIQQSYNETSFLSQEKDLGILESKSIMQDLLPDPNLVNFNDPQVFQILHEYIQVCLDVLTKDGKGELETKQLEATADTIGRYLRAYILPVAKAAYYAGHANYEETKEMFQLYDDLKIMLKTTGDEWAEPDSAFHLHFPILPLEVPPEGDKDACDELLLHDEIHNRNVTTNLTKDGREVPKVFPLPYLDDDTNPRSITVPLKKRQFMSLNMEESADSVMKFYTTAVNCMSYSNYGRRDVEHFNANLLNWITDQVLPVINNEEWYPGFGAVLRVAETAKAHSIRPGIENKTTESRQEFSFEVTEVVTDGGILRWLGHMERMSEAMLVKQINRDFFNSEGTEDHNVLFIGLIALWICLMLSCCFCFFFWYRRGKSAGQKQDTSENEKVQTNKKDTNSKTVSRQLSPLGDVTSNKETVSAEKPGKDWHTIFGPDISTETTALLNNVLTETDTETSISSSEMPSRRNF